MGGDARLPIDHALMKGKDHRNGYSAKVLGVYERLKQLNARSAGAM